MGFVVPSNPARPDVGTYVVFGPNQASILALEAITSKIKGFDSYLHFNSM